MNLYAISKEIEILEELEMLVAFFTSVYYYSHFSTNLNWISIFWNFIIFGKTLYCIYSARFSESVIKKWSSTIFCFAALFCPLLPSAIIIDTNEYLVCINALKFWIVSKKLTIQKSHLLLCCTQVVFFRQVLLPEKKN